jgi:hypothetical protein
VHESPLQLALDPSAHFVQQDIADAGMGAVMTKTAIVTRNIQAESAMVFHVVFMSILSLR